MNKHIFKILVVVGISVICCLGCSGRNNTLTLEDGILSWEEKEKTAYYEVTLGDVTITCEEEQVPLHKLCNYEGEHTVTVSSVSESDKKKEIGTLDITAVALAEPAVSVAEGDKGQTTFVWEIDEQAGGYGYNLHDGYGMKEVKIGEDGTCKVVIEENTATMFTVTTESTSKDNTFYIGNSTSYRYQGRMLFDMVQMVKYPFYTVSSGIGLDTLTFGTTLSKGIYDLEMTFYVMDANGLSISGDGLWGRRIWNVQPGGEQLIWLCENGAETASRFPESVGTLKGADEPLTCVVEKVEIDNYGESYLDLADFNVNEMIVITDIKYNGKSVMAEQLKDRSDEVKFDTKKLSKFLAVYKAPGLFYSESEAGSTFSIPVDLKDGVYTLELSYQLMDQDGTSLNGNGLWGRRIINGEQDDSQLVWYCDYPFEPYTPGGNIPLPTEKVKSSFTGKVEDGFFNIICHDFNAGEIMAVSEVKKISGSSQQFDISKLDNYKYVFKDPAGYDPEIPDQFVIETTKYERGLFDVELTYYVMDKDGWMVSGNGMWGRRIMTDSEEEIWICNTAPHEAHVDAIGTVSEPNKAVTRKAQIALNKKGRFTLYMHDFLEGEIVIIQDVKLNGKSILK